MPTIVYPNSHTSALHRTEKIVTFPDPTDKRSKILYLNEVGQEQAREVLTELRTKELKAEQALGIEKLRLLNDLNEEMLANLKGQVEDK